MSAKRRCCTMHPRDRQGKSVSPGHFRTVSSASRSGGPTEPEKGARKTKRHYVHVVSRSSRVTSHSISRSPSHCCQNKISLPPVLALFTRCLIFPLYFFFSLSLSLFLVYADPPRDRNRNTRRCTGREREGGRREGGFTRRPRSISTYVCRGANVGTDFRYVIRPFCSSGDARPRRRADTSRVRLVGGCSGCSRAARRFEFRRAAPRRFLAKASHSCQSGPESSDVSHVRH